MATQAVQMEVDVDDQLRKRDVQLTKIFALVEKILSYLPEEIHPGYRNGELVMDLDLSNEIAGLVSTIFTYMRKKNNPQVNTAKADTYEAKIRDVTFKIKEIGDIAIAELNHFDYMIATPIMNLLCAFKMSFDEVRVGTTKFMVRKDVAMAQPRGGRRGEQPIDKRDQFRTITEYGLSNQHIPLLQGITFSPERKTGLIRALGPLTQCIMLINENTYPQRIAAALKETLNMLPMHNEIVNLFKEARGPGSCQGVLKELGDILIMTTARSQQKFYLPILLAQQMYYAKGKNGDYSGYVQREMELPRR
ncbi:unnamed protein product [Psylliodes chrysocephalus]|uniref:Uncharacterized protein n=1 Tax=Psylliodes chrysocephalus TaxID=3402493 RepID=A0A9P0CNZ7_9CUCU|nr:unnamed protein product [Psylliodes chrysocephala]